MSGARPPLELLEIKLQRLARMINAETPKGFCFALVFMESGVKEGSSGYASYISNAERAGMIAGLRECANKLEKGDDNL